MQTFKNLVVWQKSIELTKGIYEATSKFPQAETFGLVSQMRRCGTSIPSNIAEGSRRKTKKDFIQFLRIADGSAAELETQILIAKNFYKDVDFSKAESLLLEIQKMLSSMINKFDLKN